MVVVNDNSSITDFQKANQAQTQSEIASAQNRDTLSPAGRLTAAPVKSVTGAAKNVLSNNPIINGGVDIVNSVVTTLGQSLVSAAIHQVSGALKPLQSAVDAYFMVLALASTATVEIAMELARGNARLIVSTIKQKEQTIAQLKTEVTALYNAVGILRHSRPFFDSYLIKLLKAYQEITLADQQLKGVISVLESKHFYNDTLFNQAMKLLENAKELILPDQTADINSIRSNVLNAANNTIASAKNTLAAALSIPAISAKIAQLMVSYAAQTLEVNALVALYLTALNDFISSYQRNTSIDQTTINHIRSATDQLDALLGDMTPLLFPTSATKGNPLYPVQVSSNATVWGIKLATIIEWLKFNPGAASQALNVTGESVRRYKQSVALLKGFNHRTFGSATLIVNESAEDIINTGQQVLRFLFDVNTFLATGKDPRSIQVEMTQFLDLLQASHGLNQDIINALTPFINTPNELLAGAGKIVKDLGSMASGLGLDRAASLIGKGNVAGLFSMNATTATFVGAALVGVRAITAKVNSNPNATDQDKQKLAAVDSDLSSQNAVKKVEATRSATDSKDTFVASKNEQLQQTNQDTDSAILIGNKYDANTSEPADSTLKGSFTKVNGNDAFA